MQGRLPEEKGYRVSETTTAVAEEAEPCHGACKRFRPTEAPVEDALQPAEQPAGCAVSFVSCHLCGVGFGDAGVPDSLLLL